MTFAVRETELDPAAFRDPSSLVATAWTALACVLGEIKETKAGGHLRALALEKAAGLLLRAAVWLRRSPDGS